MIGHNPLLFEEAQTTGMYDIGFPNHVITSLVARATVVSKAQLLRPHEVVGDENLLFLPLIIDVARLVSSSLLVPRQPNRLEMSCMPSLNRGPSSKRDRVILTCFEEIGSETHQVFPIRNLGV